MERRSMLPPEVAQQLERWVKPQVEPDEHQPENSLVSVMSPGWGYTDIVEDLCVSCREIRHNCLGGECCCDLCQPQNYRASWLKDTEKARQRADGYKIMSARGGR